MYMYLLPWLLVNFLTNYLEFYLITFETKAIPGIPIDVVAVNYAVFAISI
jgi:hypothetical protein